MNAAWPLQVAGVNLLLLAEKAIYWPERKILLVADAHFGKAAAYRALGQPVPCGTTAANLQRLDHMLAGYACEHVIFLGDFLHAPKSHAPATLALIRQWRMRNGGLQCTLIRGNHDLRAGDPPADLQIDIVTEPYILEPFALQHLPVPHATYHVIAGHLHPAFRLSGRGHQSLRLPCFSCNQDMTLLPAFGDFTGGTSMQAAHNRKLFVVHEGVIWPVHSSSGSTTCI